MPRQFSLTRRRQNLVDLLIDIDPVKVPPIASWQYEVSSSLNGPFKTLVTMGAAGIRSKTVRDFSFNDAFRGKVRFVWNPDDYASTGISDIKPIYLRVKTKDLGSTTFGSSSAVHIILPYSTSGHPPLHLAGDAPSGLSMDDAFEIQLPRNCHQFIFENLSGVNMYLAIATSGPEYKLKPGTILELFDTTSSVIYVRGEGGPAEFDAVCTIQNATDIA